MLDLNFNRIQFTPDLMPSDITGTEVIEQNRSTGKRSFKFFKGPIFTNILLADEINRTPPKTQSALLESMQEKRITYGGKNYELDLPFFVLATQNPIEQEVRTLFLRLNLIDSCLISWLTILREMKKFQL